MVEETDSSEGEESSNTIGNDQLFLFHVAEKKVMKKEQQRLRKRATIVNSQSTPIPHLIWNGSEWRIQPSKKHPMVSIKYRLCPEGYKYLGRPLPKRRCKSDTSQGSVVVAKAKAMADTGCSTMVAGLSFIKDLGLNELDLLPVKTDVRAANRSKIEILGAVVVEIRLDRAGISNKFIRQVIKTNSLSRFERFDGLFDFRQ